MTFAGRTSEAERVFWKRENVRRIDIEKAAEDSADREPPEAWKPPSEDVHKRVEVFLKEQELRGLESILDTPEEYCQSGELKGLGISPNFLTIKLKAEFKRRDRKRYWAISGSLAVFLALWQGVTTTAMPYWLNMPGYQQPAELPTSDCRQERDCARTPEPVDRKPMKIRNEPKIGPPD